MKVVIHDRTEELSAGLRLEAERKLARLSRHFHRVVEAEVHFEEERRRSQKRLTVCRIILHLDGRNAPVLMVEERAIELGAAFELALDDLDRQVVKLKEKVQERKGANGSAAADVGDVVRPAPAIQFRQAFLKPQTLDQARGALDTSGDVFHVFLNEDSGEVNVMYRRGDGGLAVIEPVVK